MILKIQFDTGWIIYSDIEKIRYKHITEEIADKLQYDEYWGMNSKGKDLVLQIISRTKTGIERIIIATGIVYLCNDNGDTMEKLFP